jgi:hypothetical protein
LTQEDDSAVVQAAVAIVFIQDLDELMYRVLTPAFMSKALQDEFEIPLCNPYHMPPGEDHFLALEEDPLYENSKEFILRTSFFFALMSFLNWFLIVPILVSMSVGVVVGLRNKLCQDFASS